MTPGAAGVALTYQAAVKTLSGRLTAVLAGLWAGVDAWQVQASWDARLGQAVGAFTAAQQSAASMADGYTQAVLEAQGADPVPAGAVSVDAFSGVAASGLSLEHLLSIPAQRVQAAVLAGVQQATALQAGSASLALYGRTEVADAARMSAQVASWSRGSYGYIRVVGPVCCSRCAILAGRRYKTSGFQRHPGCTCGMLPTTDPSIADVPSPMDLYRQGRITDLTEAERMALDHGADISQVVNARQGVYVAGGHQYTTEGTTRRGVAGARILARDIARSQGAAPGATYWNFTVSRRELDEAVARYGPLMRKGMPFLRRHRDYQTWSAYRYTRTARMSVPEIVRTSTSRDDLIRQLANHGYLLLPGDAEASTRSLERMLHP